MTTPSLMDGRHDPGARHFRLAEDVVGVGLVVIPLAALLAAVLTIWIGSLAYVVFGAIVAAWIVALLVFDVLSYRPGTTGEFDRPSAMAWVAVGAATFGGLVAYLGLTATRALEERHGDASTLGSVATHFFGMLIAASAVAWVAFLVMMARERLSKHGP